MSIRIDIPEYKLYSKYMKNMFNAISKKIIFNIFELLNAGVRPDNNGELDVSGNGLPNRFFSNNTKRMNGTKILPEYTIKIMDLYTFYKRREEKIHHSNITPTALGFYNENEEYDKENYSEDYTMPNELFDIESFIRNFKICSTVKYIFNPTIPEEKFDIGKSNIQSCHFRVIGRLEDLHFPVLYKMKCSYPECPNEITVTNFDLVTTPVKCSRDLPIDVAEDTDVRAHTLNPKYKKICNMIKLYTYIVSEIQEDGSIKDISYLLYSMDKIKHNDIDINCLFIPKDNIVGNKNSFILGLAYNNINNDKLTYNIINKTNSTNSIFLEDIYTGIKKYLEKEHNIKANDNNKIVALIIIFQLLTRLYHNTKHYSLVLGKSGSGKSYWTKILPKLFTEDVTVIDGSTVSKNIYLGGTGHLKTFDGSDNIVKGIVGTMDFIVAEESTNAINEYNENKSDSNIMAFNKTSSGDEIPVTTRGTRPYKSIASVSVLGNIKQLQSVRKYRDLISKRYKKMTKKDINVKFPLFKPVNYYIEKIHDKDLAKAHFLTRTQEPDYQDLHYLIRVGEAELARYPFFIIIEGTGKKNEEDDTGNSVLNNNIHKDQLRLELDAYFKRIDLQTDNNEQRKKFLRDIEIYVKKEFLKQKNQNFNKYDDNVINDEDINSHILNSIKLIAKSFFLFQKQFYGEPLELTRKDKKLFERFMLYNHNTIDLEESRMEKLPTPNNYWGWDLNGIYNELIEEELKEEDRKIVRPGEEIESDALSDESSETQNIFNEMEDLI